MADKSYSKEIEIRNIEKLREIEAELPPYVKDYMRGIQFRTTAKTRVAYAIDLRIFFQYLHENNSYFKSKDIKDITLEDLESLSPSDIEEYMDYLKLYSSDSSDAVTNSASSINRKTSTLGSFYRYFYKKEYIKYNPLPLVERQKLRDGLIVRLDADEIAEFLDIVEHGTGLTKKQLDYHKKTKVRDLALITLLLGTGLRVSELVGLNINDVDFRNTCVTVHRKGGKVQQVYFGDEVLDAMNDYMDERKLIEGVPEEYENALFLSLQKRRMEVNAVENLVKKYAALLDTNKHITPHKLRSTYGTALYQETSDIYLVAEVLGHSDVNTTKKHYSALEEETKRKARNAVKLRG